MGRSPRRRRSPAHLDWDNPVEVLRPEVGRPFRSRASVWIKIYMVTAAVLLPVLLLGLKAVKTSGALADAPAQAGVSSPGRFVATRALQAWLDKDPSPLPGGVIVSWNGASNPTIAVQPQADGSLATPSLRYRTEVDTFWVADGAGRQYSAAVQVGVDPRGGVALIAGPSLELVQPALADGWASGSPWPGLTEATASPAVKTAVDGWVSAYTGGDPDALRVAVGDTDPQHSYLPLSDIAAATGKVNAAALMLAGDMKTVVARVAVRAAWAGAPAADGPGASGRELVFDVLVERADTAAPIVTAWGPPGTGPALTRYGNAFPGAARVVPSTAAVSSSTSTPAPAPAPTQAAS